MMPSVFLGVDGGNSKTIALVATSSGTVLGAGRAGCSDIYGAVSAEAATWESRMAIDRALDAAQVPKDSVTHAAFSMAGADWPDDHKYLATTAHDFGLRGVVRVVNDALGALRAGSLTGSGVAVVVGTGAATGAQGLLGTWHHSWWQEPQGSKQLADHTLRAVYRAELGIEPPTSLRERVTEIYGTSTVEDVLYARTRRTNRGQDLHSSITRALLEEADRRDPTAVRIVCAHGRSLGEYGAAAARRVGLNSNMEFPLVLAGGVFRHAGRLLAESLIYRFQEDYPRSAPVLAQSEPVVGAMLLALESGGVTIDSSLRERMASTLPPEDFYAT